MRNNSKIVTYLHFIVSLFMARTHLGQHSSHCHFIHGSTLFGYSIYKIMLCIVHINCKQFMQR